MGGGSCHDFLVSFFFSFLGREAHTVGSVPECEFFKNDDFFSFPGPLSLISYMKDPGHFF